MAQSQKMSLELEKMLIEMVKERPFLFNTKHKDYKCKVTREHNWNLIADSLELESGEYAAKIWNNVRSQYVAFLRRSNKSPGSSLFFRHEKSMSFYKDSEQSFSTEYANSPLESEANITQFKSDEEGIDDEIDLKSESLTSSLLISPHLKAISLKRKFGESEEKNSRNFDEEGDELESYGKLIASKLRKISKKNKLVFLKTQKTINNIIYEAEVKTLLNI